MWKAVTGYEGLYEVSSFGEVCNHKGRIMRAWDINSGYLSLKLTKDSKPTPFLVHRLVAREFCKGYSPELEVDHINSNKQDNRAENLRWVTRKENIGFNVERGTNSIAKARESIDNRKSVVMIDCKTGKEIRRFPSVQEASLFVNGSTNGAHISSVCNGKRAKAYGYMWKHV